MAIKSVRSEGKCIAPDGQVSSLGPELYSYVRSDAFIARYGDWCRPGYKGLVLDQHGEPKVLWHGSPVKFDAFDMSYAGMNSGLGTYVDHKTGQEMPNDSAGAFFFSDSRMQAASYGFLGWTKALSRVYKGLGKVMLALYGINGGDVLETVGFMNSITRKPISLG